jgi:hypothetical protein
VLLPLSFLISTFYDRFVPDEPGLRLAQLPSHCPLTTDYRLLTTAHATSHSGRGPSQGRVHWWTSARKSPKKSHLVSLFDRPGVRKASPNPFEASQFRRDHWTYVENHQCTYGFGKALQCLIRKSFHDRWIELETGPSRASKTACETWTPKSLISIFADCSLS